MAVVTADAWRACSDRVISKDEFAKRSFINEVAHQHGFVVDENVGDEAEDDTENAEPHQFVDIVGGADDDIEEAAAYEAGNAAK